MSNALAIAAVSNTLRTLIDRGLRDGTSVTIQPPDLARGNLTTKQVNLFLYQVAINPAWRNMEIPGRVKPGETGMPPLALNLYYLMTVYAGDNDDDTVSQTLLGRAMSILHDHPVLGRDEIRAALRGNDLYAQVERIRLTMQPLTLDDIFKLWSGYQTQYRLSVAYEATVVLIDSAIASKVPLPVLTFGPDDTGPVAQADLIPPYAALDPEAMSPRVDVTPGSTLTLGGHHLDAGGGTVVVRFRSPTASTTTDVPAAAGATDEQVAAVVPATLTAGVYTVAAVVRKPGEDERTTNEVPFALAPVIDTVAATGQAPPAGLLSVAANAQGIVDLTLAVRPPVGPDQRASLLFGDREVPAQVITGTNPSGQLRFLVPGPAPRRYRLRVRIDGVDSPVVDWTKTPPAFLGPVVEVTP